MNIYKYINMTDSQYNRYNNLLIFIKEWRKYKMPDKPLSLEAFRNEIQTEEYVKINCLNTVKNRKVAIYLFDKDSKYAKVSLELKKLLKKITHTTDVILITHSPFNTYGRKAIQSFKNINIYTYRHEIFDLVLPNGPLCYPHRIMQKDEVLKICNEDLFCYLTNLPKIFDEDPQCIWLGAESGDVLEIKMLSDISGEAVQYRVVVPRSGRVIFAKENQVPDADSESNVAEDNEDLDEHRELNAIDVSDDESIDETASDL